jgi:predicted glycoside hydrolase/deacetylase ChbG (UPF0249 family)
VSADRRLVVNADDFGLSAGVNAGIVRAHVEGIVTSTSLMVHGAAAEAAAEAAAQLPRLAVGLHVDLAEWECVDGDWRAVYERVDTADPVAVGAELEDQLRRFCQLVGREPSHLDSHQHVHRSEPVRSLMGARAKALRVPLRHHGRVRYCGAFYGRGHANAPQPEAVGAGRLAALIAGIPAGATELCCHPGRDPEPGGYGAERVLELQALCDPRARRAADDAGVRLCTFAEALRDLPA